MFGYGLGRAIERLPEPECDEFALPDLAVGVYDWVVSFDHSRNRAWIVAHGESAEQSVQSLLDAVAPTLHYRSRRRKDQPVAIRSRRRPVRESRAGGQQFHAIGIRIGGCPRHRVHLRRRRVPSQSVATIADAARRASVGPVWPTARVQSRAVWIVFRSRRFRDRQRVAGAISRIVGRRRNLDSPDQGNCAVAASIPPRTLPCATICKPAKKTRRRI